MEHLHTAIFGGLYLDTDLRRNLENNTQMVFLPYAVRSSLFTQTSSTPDNVEQLIKRLPELSPRVDCVVKSDLRRNWFEVIQQYQPDVILIDLTAEWYRVLQDSAGKLFTASPEFRQHIRPLLKGTYTTAPLQDMAQWRLALELLRQKLLTLNLLEKTIFVELQLPNNTVSSSALHSEIFRSLGQKYESMREVFPDRPLVVHQIARHPGEDEPANPFQLSQADHQGLMNGLKSALSKLSKPAKTIEKRHYMPIAKKSFVSYINKRSAGSPASALAAAESFVDRSDLAIPGFSEFHFSIPAIWAADPFHNRTWKWYVHQLVFLPWLVALARQRKSPEIIQIAKDIVKSWWKFASENPENPDLWHDHGSALRARNILDLIVALDQDGEKHSADLSLFKNILSDHQQRLLDPQFYSRHTNHGFDQSLVLFEISIYGIHYLNQDQTYLATAMKRLDDEISHAFASDGGHVENSPGYLVYGLKQALAAQSVVQKLLVSPPKVGIERARYLSAMDALSYSIRPDGKLPHIGDTADFVVKDFIRKDPSIEYQHFLHAVSRGTRGKAPKQLSKVLPVSGWAMVRSTYSDTSDYRASVHIVFKCGFLSTYHRQDDDLSFVLFGGGEDWLIDGGLYKHAPQDPFRVHVRSHNAHNLAAPIGRKALRTLPSLQRAPGFIDYSDDQKIFRIAGHSHMFDGFESQRELVFDRSTSEISISDKILPQSTQAKEHIAKSLRDGHGTYRLRFIAPTDKQIEQDDNGIVTITSRHKSGRIIISPKNTQGLKAVEISKAGQEPISGAWRSTVPGKIEPAYSIDYLFSGENLNSEMTIKMELANKN